MLVLGVSEFRGSGSLGLREFRVKGLGFSVMFLSL